MVWSIRTFAAAAITAVALAGSGGAVLAATTGGGSSAGPGRPGGFEQPGQTGQVPGPDQGGGQAQGAVPRHPGMSRVTQLPFSTDPRSGADT